MQAQENRYLICYCDDDIDDLEMVQALFEPLSNKIDLVTFSKSAEFVSVITSESAAIQPCLIILDLNMPVFGGLEVLKIIRNMDRLKRVPVVVFSTSSNPESQLAAKALDAQYLIKPVTAAGLGSLVDKFLSYCQMGVYSM